MSKRVYISADYSEKDGDRNVIDVLHKWGKDNYHKVDYVDTASVVKGSVSETPDCRYCDLKAEFNRQINISSAVVFIIGDKTALRTAGSGCERYFKEWYHCWCTPYKQNTNGMKQCIVYTTSSASDNNVGNINTYSYLRHEFEQAVKSGKTIVIVYNSLNKQPGWLPSYMSAYKDMAWPFWTRDSWGNKIGNYEFIKKALGYE